MLSPPSVSRVSGVFSDVSGQRPEVNGEDSAVSGGTGANADEARREAAGYCQRRISGPWEAMYDVVGRQEVCGVSTVAT